MNGNIFIQLGSNKGDRYENIENAKRKIEKLIGSITKESTLYETEPWGFETEVWFYNQVIIIESDKSPEKILRILLKIEDELGRVRMNTSTYEARPIDLDILFYRGTVIKNDTLIIPHPRLHLRNFSLIPCLELEPKFVHPVSGLTIKKLYEDCKDDGRINIVKL